MRWLLDSLIRLCYLTSAENRRRAAALMLIVFLALGVVAGAGVGIYSWLSQSVFFQVTDIKVAGCQRVSRDTILNLAGVDSRTNLIALSPDRIRRQIAANPWVEKVRVHRDWPSRLEIYVRERQPVAFLNTSNGLKYVDRHGDVFVAVDQDDDLDLPTITGLEKADFSVENTPVVSELTAALRFIHYAGRGSSFLLSQNISEIHVNNGGFILFLADNPFPVYLGHDISRKKYNRLARVLRWLYKKRKFENVAYIRLGYGDKKVLVGEKDNEKG